MLRTNHQELASTKRILELNPDHALIAKINALHGVNRQSDEVAKWIRLLYDQALILEGSPIEDPGLFASRMTEMMQVAVSSVE
jgi:molecular chaperone HtpG